jgi:hypothetical protein
MAGTVRSPSGLSPPGVRVRLSVCGSARGRVAFVAGCAAGLTMALDERSRRIALALYISTRTLEFAYLYLMRRGLAPHLPHGDALVMALSSSQIINALVMEPDTLAVRGVAPSVPLVPRGPPREMGWRRPWHGVSDHGGWGVRGGGLCSGRITRSCWCMADLPSTASWACPF